MLDTKSGEVKSKERGATGINEKGGEIFFFFNIRISVNVT